MQPRSGCFAGLSIHNNNENTDFLFSGRREKFLRRSTTEYWQSHCHCAFLCGPAYETILKLGGTVFSFQLSQPEAGGATVFPLLKLTVLPSKVKRAALRPSTQASLTFLQNDAIFWYNLLKSGDGDKTTVHGACPVLAGVKWVSNKWIHLHGQEFRRSCALDPQEYE